MPKLSISLGDSKTTHELSDDRITIGRASDNEIEARPAETSEKPLDFANASPFPNRKKEKDMLGAVVLGAAAVAILALLLSMLSLLQMHGPIS